MFYGLLLLLLAWPGNQVSSSRPMANGLWYPGD